MIEYIRSWLLPILGAIDQVEFHRQLSMNQELRRKIEVVCEERDRHLNSALVCYTGKFDRFADKIEEQASKLDYARRQNVELHGKIRELNRQLDSRSSEN